MKIKPLHGIENINFGDTKQQIIDFLGEADSVQLFSGQATQEQKTAQSEIHYYAKHALTLYYDGDLNARLFGISTSHAQVQFKDIKLIGLTEQNLLTQFPQLELDATDGFFKNYVDKPNELTFLVRSGVVKRIDIAPNLITFFKTYGECYSA
ncbi:hypothetical protein C2869_01810 [Saccharobesus litoralis]|uniref:Uncharacterized protein n=1 Tax=Saccharobesus litoralis TaxID=2172099 RepID=A0A2S0VM13_9ALTE|nr:hypothetical protein [Saccharobesus litoralis]AWB65257.1 hypothetical protein C2869_01810 [Saccharobesus litoralis]